MGRLVDRLMDMLTGKCAKHYLKLDKEAFFLGSDRKLTNTVICNYMKYSKCV